MAESLIRLKYAASLSFSPGGGIGSVEETVVSVKVKNIASAKDVGFVCALADGTWVDKSMKPLSTFGNYEVFFLSGGAFTTVEFALRYTVDGQTFWDNNNGVNYRVNELQPNTVGGNVVLNIATAQQGSEEGAGIPITTSWVEGTIYVKNLSFNKRVGIRLSSNDWLSFSDTDAVFSGTVSVAEGSSQVEIWTFKTPELNLNTSSPDFHFSILYNDLDSGEWFWDDNFGQSYTLSKTSSSTDN